MDPKTPDGVPERQFEAFRPLMFSIAYRMLGSVMEAEDIVQDAYLRYQTMPAQDIQSYRALLSTIVVRLCLNHLDLAQSRRELYVGPWLPEPLLTTRDSSMLLPESHLKTYDSISMAFMILLEKLNPVERAVFLLHEVFDYSYREIAEVLEKEEANCRQLLRRAKKHMAECRLRFKVTPQAHQQVLDSFIQAVTLGELDELLRLLADDVMMWADGGGSARGAATKPIHGPDAVARFVLFSTNYLPDTYQIEKAEVNGATAIILRENARPLLVISIDTDGLRIHAIRIIANPQKLTRL